MDGEIPKEVLTERKARLEDLLVKLGKEHDDLMGHVRHVTMTDDQLSYIEEFCAKIRVGLENADFKTKGFIPPMSDRPERTATAIAHANIALVKFTLASPHRTDRKGCF